MYNVIIEQRWDIVFLVAHLKKKAKRIRDLSTNFLQTWIRKCKDKWFKLLTFYQILTDM